MEGSRKSQDFTDLLAWQKAHELVLNVYGFSANFPKSEQYGLTSQLRRAAVSIPANLAEGFKKRSKIKCVFIMLLKDHSSNAVITSS